MAFMSYTNQANLESNTNLIGLSHVGGLGVGGTHGVVDSLNWEPHLGHSNLIANTQNNNNINANNLSHNMFPNNQYQNPLNHNHHHHHHQMVIHGLQ